MKKKSEIRVEKMGKRHSKWDMDKVRTLYIQGAEIADILKLPEFCQLSRYYVKNVMIKGKWSQQRQLIRAQAAGLMEKTLVESIRDHQDEHLRFMLKQIAEERAEIVARRKQGNIRDQKERLDLLDSLDKTARRTLGLDEQNLTDKAAMSVNAMINLHIAGPQKADVSETITVEYQKQEDEPEETRVEDRVSESDNACRKDEESV